MIGMFEYIWLDGAKPTQKLRSKTRMINLNCKTDIQLGDLPKWSFDGSSTYQADGNSSDLELVPVTMVKDPIRGGDQDYLVLCEVMNPDGSAHTSNSRARLRDVLDKGASKEDPRFGFEQEYTFMKGNTPLGWPEHGYPAPQGPFYCGVGSDEVFGREIVELHAAACIASGLMIYGVNAEVMPGQWEYQIGPRGDDSEKSDPLTIADHNWLARWLLYRIGEEFGVSATLAPKPVKGDWNGAGQHTNFSTAKMRNKETGRAAIEDAINALATKHNDHIDEYGADLHERLTGDHETCDINTFKYGDSDRGASIRLPLTVSQKGYGYLEDRRPGANADPYQIATIILKTICHID